MFDLMKYVESADDPKDLDDSFIDELMCFEYAKHEHPEPQTIPQDISEQTADCPPSPCSQTKEIVDYFESTHNSISASPLFDEEMKEPDWLSSWDS